MQNMPILKFEKGTKYLNDQLEVQQNNKQLILDIITNIGLIATNAADTEDNKYNEILESANTFLQTISNNLTLIQQLNIEITSITSDLTELLSNQDKNSKSKEFYIASFSNIKNKISKYTEKFQEVGLKLENDNNEFNDFINKFKYNFISNDAQDSFEFSGFSVNDTTLSVDNKIIENTLETENDTIETENNAIESENKINESNTSEKNESEDNEILEENLNKKDEEIEKLTNDFRNFLVTLYEENTNESNPINVLANYFNQKAGLNREIFESNLEESANTEETVSDDKDKSEIIIDYSSLYGDFHNNTIAMEKDIFDEYSTFSPDVNLPKTPIKPVSISEDNRQIMKIDSIPEETVIEDINDSEIEDINDLDIENIADNNLDIKDINIIDNDLENELLHNSILEDILNSEIELSDLENSILSEKKQAVVKETDSNEITPTNTQTVKKESKVKKGLSKKERKLKKKLKAKQKKDALQSEKLQVEKQEESSNEKDVILKSFSHLSSDYDLSQKINSIYEATSDNDTLIISEKENKIYLPYTIDEVERYIKSYPEVYFSATDVVDHEFVLPFNIFFKHPVHSRFLETYNLMRNREGTSVIFSVFYASKMAYKKNLNPAIIAACKTESDLENYLEHLDSNELDKFNCFKIIYEINPS
jgi:hypothetical protein